MYNLCLDFNAKELEEIEKIVGSNYVIVDKISGECYILCEKGSKSYNECFTNTDNNYFMKQMYELAKPYRAILFNNNYIVEVIDERDIWYRGRKDANRNIELTCFSESLEEALESI
jgi:hypothetical protein